jgi:hypothetical protein
VGSSVYLRWAVGLNSTVSCVNLLPLPQDDIAFLRTAHQIYLQYDKLPEALSLAVRLGDSELIRHDFNISANPYDLHLLSIILYVKHSSRVMKRQLAFLLARAQIPIEWLQPPTTDDDADGDADIDFQDELPEDLLECLSNTRLSTYFREFGKELGVADPKSLEDVYKSHLENTRGYIESSRTTDINALCHEQDQPRQPMSILRGETLLEHSSMRLSTLDLAMTSSWSKLKKETVGYTRIRTTVGLFSSTVPRLYTNLRFRYDECCC